MLDLVAARPKAIDTTKCQMCIDTTPLTRTLLKRVSRELSRLTLRLRSGRAALDSLSFLSLLLFFLLAFALAFCPTLDALDCFRAEGHPLVGPSK